MKTRKAKSIIVVTGACALVIFSVAVFPFILAASPVNRGITTIESESLFPAEETEQTSEIETLGEVERFIETETIPNINAITKEQAIAIASESLVPKIGTYFSISGTDITISRDFLEAKYMECPDPLVDPSWYVLFATHSSGTTVSNIPEGITPEEYLQKILDDPLLSEGSDPMIGTDSNGNPVVIDRHDRTGYVVAEVNALTGEYICFGSTLADNFSLDFFTCADDIKQVLVYSESWEPEPAG